MFKSFVKYALQVAVILALGQVPVGKSTVGAEFTSSVARWYQQAWKMIREKRLSWSEITEDGSKTLKMFTGAASTMMENEAPIPDRDLKTLLPAEEFSEFERAKVKELLEGE